MRHSVFLFIIAFSSLFFKQDGSVFKPGQVWKDTDGNPINAHSAGLMYDNGTYYWYGEIKSGNSWLVEYTGWECYRVNVGGVSCYSSKDLYHWKNEGVALAPVTADSTSDIHTSKVIERPKVIYNETTKKYVMWMHIDSEDYKYARAGVATSDKPQGPYTYLGSLRPNGQMSRDQTLFREMETPTSPCLTAGTNSTSKIRGMYGCSCILRMTR